jgi:hypothetical protein
MLHNRELLSDALHLLKLLRIDVLLEHVGIQLQRFGEDLSAEAGQFDEGRGWLRLQLTGCSSVFEGCHGELGGVGFVCAAYKSGSGHLLVLFDL